MNAGDFESSALPGGIRVACLPDGTLDYRGADGLPASDAERARVVAEMRPALVALLERALAQSQSLIRLDTQAMEPAFRRLPVLPDPAPSTPRPVEPRPADLPSRSVAQWLVPPLWSAAKSRATAEHRQRMKEYRIADAAWERAYLDPAYREQLAADAMAAYKMEKARALKLQLQVMAGTDIDAVRGSFRRQLQESPWAALLDVRPALANDCSTGTFTIGVPSLHAFAPHCPPPASIDDAALRLRVEPLTAAETSRRYHAYLVVSTLKVASAAFVAIPPLLEATLLTVARKSSSNGNAARAPAIRVSLTRQVWQTGWQRPQSPLFELQRLRGTLVLPSAREPSGPAKVEDG